MTHDQAYKSARKSANTRQEIRIVYYDPDYTSFEQCSENQWDIWIDNGEVDYIDLRDFVMPQTKGQ